jgi:hypothetical protein
MTRELDKNAIHKLLESAGRTIPDLDGHNIRVAERRILWSKVAQTPADAPLIPPSATPEQVAEWSKPRTYEEWEESIRHQQPAANPTDVAALEQGNKEDELSQLLRPRDPAAPGKPAPAPTGVAHVQRPAPKKENVIQLPEMNIEGDPNEMLYTPGPNDPNYTGASKGVTGLLRIAGYLSRKKS